ncbi:glycosyltransferase [Edaphocola aurantiacus]|uniref:glycosyltransferase n=1 Tax=Edaphocola aurantiacus TaxID=2601682 RepID=UPI001C960936|nr:DUF1972 domain-containing protein [Edaphocola aurantiacus]
MKIAILGSRGIPNAYGGFEQYAEQLSRFLADRGCEVYVYCSSAHPYKASKLGKVFLKHQYDPEWLGTAGQFVYDYNCIRDARKEKFDIVYQLGYTSSAIFNRMMPASAILITNMDGMEWQRSKYSPMVQRFLKWSESLVVKRSHYLIADAIPIQEYIRKQYHAAAYYSAYTSVIPAHADESLLEAYSLVKKQYSLLIARMEPENNIEPVLEAYAAAAQQYPLIVIGNTDNHFGRYLLKKFATPNIRFLGSIYDKPILDTLRQCSAFYFHGHSVGGTNPSLLEAMASKCSIIAHDNVYNRSVLQEHALFFATADELKDILININQQDLFYERANAHNVATIEKQYSEAAVFEPLYHFFRSVLKSE